MALYKSLALITLLVIMSAIESESRVARKDLGVDLGGVGVGVGAGMGVGLGGSGSGVWSWVWFRFRFWIKFWVKLVLFILVQLQVKV
ncbi:hypothetical protein OIU77_005849 [Salix suchowensis]|uniref:Glycine-rich protein n=1 Tax=Salix suchowensis TaxID=1278906 RepID=A0ABQ9ASG9_9ROSI|nr:hypothetical protein OIU77_005849 [Salix suchowensis]